MGSMPVAGVGLQSQPVCPRWLQAGERPHLPQTRCAWGMRVSATANSMLDPRASKRSWVWAGVPGRWRSRAGIQGSCEI